VPDSVILIVSHTHDAHALEVMQRLEQHGCKPVLFDTARIPRETKLELTHERSVGWSGSAQLDGRLVDLRAVKSVWWRRPQPFNLHAEVGGSEDRAFALAETYAAVSGLWSLLDARWMNDPDCDEKAGRKAWQLKVARDVGLAIPSTCITNDPSRARSFVDSHSVPIIYKTFSATERTWRETRLLRPEEEMLRSSFRNISPPE
jgi:hypothetical protein